jgi:membrane-bound lytic murein transglycosylase F
MKKFSQVLLKRSMVATLLLLSISVSSQEQANLDFAHRGKPLRVVLLEQSTSLSQSGSLALGLEAEILQEFAKDFGYQIQWSSRKSHKDILNSRHLKSWDLMGGRWAEALKAPAVEGFESSLSYDSDRVALICKPGAPINYSPQSQIQVNHRMTLLVPQSPLFKRYAQLIQSQSKHVKLQADSFQSSKKTFQNFIQRSGDCLLSFHLEASFYRKIFPSLNIVKIFNLEHSFSFLVNSKNQQLLEDFIQWMTLSKKRHLVDQLKRRISGRHLPLKDIDYEYFYLARKTVLPSLKLFFEKSSTAFNLPWYLMAAIAYQESKWNNEAVSFTGVRGLMQITAQTAEFLELEDRMNPEKSIAAASKYIRILYDRTPKYLPAKERLALALATYNIGPAHMIDAQNLSIRLGKNPHSWNDLKNVLPLLADEQFASYLKYGRARGEEPVQFVNYVLTYFEILKHSI